MKTAKLLREKSREYKGQSYYKFKVNIPNMIITKSRLTAGDVLEVEAEEGKIILRKKKD